MWTSTAGASRYRNDVRVRTFALLAAAAMVVTLLPPQVFTSHALAQEALTPGEETGRVRGTAWVDTDGDGVRGSHEEGFEGLRVELVDTDGATADAASSDLAGSYELEGVDPGSYTLRVAVPDGYQVSPIADDDASIVNSFEATEDGDDVAETEPFVLDAQATVALNLGLNPVAEDEAAPTTTTTTTTEAPSTTTTTEATVTTRPDPERVDEDDPALTTTTTESDEGEGDDPEPIVGDGGITTQAQVACTPEPGYVGCEAFTYSGADQGFTVPAGVVNVYVKAWGAGAGGSINTGLDIGAPGGSGGYVEGVLDVLPGSEYVVMVGGGGGADGTPNTSNICDAAYGFGGACVPPRTVDGNYIDGGGGGGLSGLFTGSAPVTDTDQNRAALVAGGGGAGEGTNQCDGMSAAGGAGGNGFAGAMPTMQGEHGAFTDSPPIFGSDPTGGGGGYFGGDGTDRLRDGDCALSANGGSNFVAADLSDTVDLAGNEAATVPQFTVNDAPNNTDPHYTAGVGVGEVELGVPGGDGLVVLQWTEPLPTFSCDSTAYLFQQVPSDVWEGDLVTGVFEEEASDIEDTHINGVGFNVLDGYIYGWSNSAAPGGTSYPAGLVRIGSDYSVQHLGIPDELTESTLIGHGDVDTNGYYWARRSDVDPDQWVQIDLRPGETTFGEVVDSGDLLPPTDLSFQNDWSYNPADGLLYGIGAGPGGARHLISFDPDTKAVNDEGQLSAISGGAFGATYMDANGFLYASDNSSGDIYRVNVADVTAEFFVNGPSAGFNDGARCAEAPLPVDFGDAPSTYGTLLGDAGPRHAIPGYDPGTNTAPLMLGSLIDIDSDGQPTADADGDDTTDVADEDGVVDPIALLPGQSTTVTVNATNTSGEAATLVAWIDLDNDGVFEADEWQSVPVPDGTTGGDFDLTFDPPTFIGDGTYARFRLFPGDVTDPEPTGPAAAGEVEDYLVTGPLPEPLPECDARAFQSLAASSSDPSDWYSFDLVTGNPTLINEGMGPDDDININAIGYNVVDDRIYGIERDTASSDNTGYVVVVGNDGVGYRLGPLTDIANADPLFIGDVSPDGILYAAHSLSTTVYLIDVDPDSPDFLTVDTMTRKDDDGDAGTNIGADWAFSPTGELYSVRPNGELVTMDPDTGEVDLVGQIANVPTTGGKGALYFDASGLLYIYQNADGDIYRVDPNESPLSADLFSEEGPSVGSNDGARCPNAPVPVDFGDAPSTYGTLLGDAGPRHAIPGYDPGTNTAPLMLGSLIDVETDGVPSADADGDDVADVDDEDAVAGPITLVVGQPLDQDVDVTNGTGDVATLVGWIDINDDGDFDDAGERDMVVVPANSGLTTQTLSFAAPGGPSDGTYARFRLFPGDVTGDDPQPTGSASAGEVEDYPVIGPVAINIDCPTVYAAQGSSPYNFYEVDPDTGQMTSIGLLGAGTGTNNALGFSADSQYIYSYRSGFPGSVQIYDTFTGDVDSVGGSINSATHGAVNPQTGIYYYGTVNATSGTVYAFDTNTNTNLGLVATIDWEPEAEGGNGDWAFDAQGNLYVVAGQAPDNPVYVVSEPLPTTAQPSPVTMAGERLSVVTTGTDAINGIAFDGNGHLYLASSQNLFRVHPSSGAVLEGPIPLDPSGQSVDLGSCATPATIRVLKNIVDRFTPADQFEVTVTGGGIAENNVGVTEGTDTGLQDEADEAAGPVLGLPGDTYDISETGASGADLATYTTTWECVNENDGAVVADGTGASGSFVMPDSVDGAGAAIVCTFTNEPVDVDFGDAPDSYGTTQGTNGPFHGIPGYDDGTNTAPVMLGSLIDAEADGQPSADADGDDTTNAADEDGVAFNPALGYQTPTLRTGLDPDSLQPVENTLEVDASADGFVSVWVDWNQDGDFDDAGEQVANAEAVVAGLNDITFAQGTNPDDISTYVRVRYSTDEGSIATPYGPAPDGEVEDYQVLIERLNQPDACVDSGEEYYAFTFSPPVTQGTTGNVGDTARYENVSVINGVAVDMFVEVIDGDLRETTRPPNGFGVGNGTIIGTDDAQWNVQEEATLRYHFYEAGTTNPVSINGVFTINDMDEDLPNWRETASFDPADLASYALTQGSAVTIAENAAGIHFLANGDWDGDPESRFQIVLEGISTFDTRWRGAAGSGFGFDGDGDLGVDPPACEDWGDAPDSYGTTAATNGPNHTIVPGLTLGSEIDFDTDGQPTPDADGDDTANLADEDGVAGPIVLQAGQTTTVDVDVTNTTGDDAILAGWIDLDNSGSFDPGELQTIPVPDGTTDGTFQLNFDPPTAFGDTYARFRLFPDDGTPITPTGPADAGEVEDYPVTGAVQPQWSCPADGLLFQYPGGTPTNVQFVDLVTGEVDTDAMEIEDRGINAAAYNISDDYVYGWDNTLLPNGERVGVVRIGPDESVDVLGVPDHAELNPGWTFPVGDIDSDGQYWVINSTGAGQNARWFQIDLNPGPTFMEVISTGLVRDGGDTVGFGGSGDWAWIPSHDAIYRVMREGGTTQWSLFRFDRGTGEHQRIGALPQMNGYTGTFGAAYADPDFLYVSHNGGGDIFRIDIDAIEAELFVEDGPPSGANDGARCATAPVPIDFGDAPDTYETLLGSDGARHGVPGYVAADNEAPLMLGSSIDIENDATPGPDADGDDTTDAADEDGLVGPIVFLAGEETSVEVEVTNDTGEEATLTGWIDLNGDGDFDANERSQTLVTVPANTTGTFTLDFDAGTTTDDTYARFRLYGGAVADPQPTGPASAGEVEDYLVPSGQVHYQKTVTPDDTPVLQPGDVYTYSVTVSNLGSIPLSDLSFTDDLSGVVGDGDATYNADVAVVSGPGTAVFNAPDEIAWDLAGDTLAVGGTATVEYSVTIADPPGGDAILSNGVLGTGPGSNCTDNPPTDPDCYVEIPQPLIDGVKTSDAAGEAEPGETVNYEFTVSNVGPGAANNAVVWDDLSGVLDDAIFDAGSLTLAPAGQGQVTFDAANERIVWNGPLDAQGDPLDEVTITYSVTVNEADDMGDGVMANALLMTGCPNPPIFDPTHADFNEDCVEIIDVPAWTVDKSSDAVDPVQPEQTITYTITVENTGGVDLPAADVLVEDDLSGVLDDAVYNGDADQGATYSAPIITWSDDLAVDEVVVITYTVTVNEADSLGDGQLLNAVTGGDCPDPAVTDPQAQDFDPDCVLIHDVAAYTVDKSSDASDPVQPGDDITYTITVENTGNVDLPAGDVLVEDDLTGVLDDAVYNGDADQGAAYSQPIVSWSDDLAVDEVVVITYSVTVNDATELGDGQLLNAVTGGDCPDPAITNPQHTDFDTDCVNIEDIEAWTAVKTSDAVGNVEPGDVVNYTIEIENTGNVALAAADVVNVDDLTEVLDDASYDGNAADGGHAGTFDFTAPTLTWSGDLAVDEQVTLTYSVTINDATDLGDGELLNAITGSTNCPDPAITDPQHTDFDPDCVNIDPIEAWTAVKTSDAVGNVEPGDVVNYTIEIENTGNVPVTAINVDDLTEVLDDASYDGNAADGGHAGNFDFTAPTLTWSGDLAVDEVVTLTYSVTVNDATDLGDGELVNAITGSSNCPDPAITDPQATGYDPDCVNVDPIEAWTAVKTSDAVGNVSTGDTVSYTIEIENTGNVPLTAADVVNVDDLTEVLDDASYDGNAADGGHAGTFDFTSPTLTWSGDLAVDEVVTLTYSVTVNDAEDLGDGELLNAITGSTNCPDPAITDPQDTDFDPECVNIEEVAAYTVVKTSDAVDPVLPGDVVEYTVVVTNTGNVDLTGADAATFDDDLTGVLDDATFNNDESADVGTATFSDPGIAWSGDLGVDDVATITYSVTVDQPIGGDHQLANAVVGGDCPDPAITDPEDAAFDETCVVVDPLPGVDITKVIFGDPVTDLQPGDTFEYVVTVENIGQVDLVGETFSDDLSEVLDDAELDQGSMTADIGTVNFADPELTWTGDLDIGETATIRYSITIDDPITGDAELRNAVVGPTYSNCVPPDASDPDCWEETPLPNVHVSKELVGPENPQPGDVVTYRITAENRGGAISEDEVVTDDLSGVLDDAVYNEDAVASHPGSLSYSEPEIAWIGDIPAGESLVITYSVTVNAAGELGDATMENSVTGGENCPDDVEQCRTETPLPTYEASKRVETSLAEPGGVVTYYIDIVNTGEVAVSPAVVVDDLSGVLDDATYRGDAAASVGSVRYSDRALVWTGPLAVGETVTLTYSVEVNAANGLGDGSLLNTIAAPNCTDGLEGQDSHDQAVEDECVTVTGVAAVAYEKTIISPTEEVEAGDVVTYRVRAINQGATDLTDLQFIDDLSAVLAHATYWGEADASSGNVSYDAPILTWNGDIPAGESVSVTYSVRLDRDAPAGTALENVVVGDGPGSNCPPGSGDPRCVVDVAVDDQSPLPVTGADLARMAAVALSALLAGMTLVRLGRRQEDDLRALLDRGRT